MKKQIVKKALAVVLGASMILGIAACGKQDPVQDSKESESKVVESSTTSSESSTVVEEPGVKFPLEEEMSFTIMYRSKGTDITEKLENNVFWQDLYEATNVKIELVALPADETMTKLNAMFMSNDEGDAIFSSFIKDADLSQMAANNLLQPLNEYVDDAELMPNFNERVLGESPQTKGVITSPDGNIYALPCYTADPGSYIESPLWINKTWLDKLGKEIPTTSEELEEVLIAFRDNDMNGNGVTDDEIPLLLQQGNAYSHFESILGLYGIATKDGTYENDVFLEDGKVIFAPTSQNYKDALVQLNDWWEKELIWQEAFTSTNDTWTAKITSAESVVGVVPFLDMGGYSDEYVQMAPVSVEGYEVSWYIHPGLSGVKTRFSITRSCENVDVLMAWIDYFYSFENSVRIRWGEESEGRYSIVDGTVVMNNLDTETSKKIKEETPTINDLITSNMWAITASDYDEGRIARSGMSIRYNETYDLYKEYLNDEVWPRPYFASDVSSRLSELRTDIFNLVNEKKAAWITGTGDIEAEWDEYCASLNKMGVEEFVSLMQDAYDIYVEAQK